MFETFKISAVLIMSVSMTSLAWAGSSSHYPAQTPQAAPPSAVAGQCYARIKIPAQYEYGTEGVIVEESYQTVNIAQPQLSARQENVLVKEASTRYEVTQPRYTNVTEQVLVSPAYDKLSVTPPTFKTVKDTIATSAPHLVWKKGNPGHLISQGYTIHGTANGGVGGQGFSSTSQYGASGAAGGETCGDLCEIWCLVEEPGETTTYFRKVLDQPARVKRSPVQAKYQTINKQVLAQPGSVREIPIPAEYRSVTVQDLVSSGGEDYVTVPPKYGSVKTKRLIAPERYEWRQAVCAPGTIGAATGGVSQSYGHSSSSVTGYTGYASGSSYNNGTSSYSGSGSSYGHSGTSYSGGDVTIYGSGTSYSSTAPSSQPQPGQLYYEGTDLPVRAPHRSGR